MYRKILSGLAAAALVATTAAPTVALARDHGWHGHRSHHGYSNNHYRGRHYAGYRCKRDSGTGGLLVGAIAGGLLGNEVARDKTAGAVIGAGVGGLAGRAIDRSDSC